MVGSAVMIIILSFLNGLEGLVKGMNDAFDPDIKITPKYGKTFTPDSLISVLQRVEDIEAISKVLEDNAVVRYGDAQEIARIKGVDNAFSTVTNIDTFVVYGSFQLEGQGKQYAVFGSAISSSLNISLRGSETTATLFVPKKGVEYNQLNPEASLNMEYIIPSGVMVLNEDGDKDIILAPLKLTQDLLGSDGKITGVEIRTKPGKDDDVHHILTKQLGESYNVQNRSEQNEAAYRVFKTEKWATFAILTLVILIAAFNTIGALTMLVLEKKKDIYILKSMGAENGLVRRIFMSEGMLITWLGLIAGLAIGIGFVLIQDKVGVIRLDGSFVDYFPVGLKLADVLSVSLVITVMGAIASVYPSLKAGQQA